MNAAQGISFKIYEFHQRRIYIYEIHNEKVLMLLMLIPKNLKQAYNTKKWQKASSIYMQILVQILNFARREKASSKPPQVPEFPKRETMSSKMSWMKEAKITFQFFHLTSFVLLFFLNKGEFQKPNNSSNNVFDFFCKLFWILKLLIDCDRLTLQKPLKLKKYNYFTKKIFFQNRNYFPLRDSEKIYILLFIISEKII